MGEQLRNSGEHQSENLDLSAEVEKNLKRAEAEAEKASDQQPNTSELAQKVEQQAISGKEITIGESESGASSQEYGAYTEMKGQAYKKTLGRIQSRLSAPEKTMSKVMHNKTIESVSDGIGKTAARPSGILGGGIVALIGSSTLLYMAKKYGFEYNFFIFFVLLAGGFVLGVIAELFVKAIVKSRH